MLWRGKPTCNLAVSASSGNLLKTKTSKHCEVQPCMRNGCTADSHRCLVIELLTTAHAHTMGIDSRKPYSAPAQAARSAGGRNITVNHTYRRPKMIRPATVCS